MMRGTFANTRIKQKLTTPREGGFTRKLPEGVLMHVYDAAREYAKEGIELIVLAGREYGTGSSRDWAAKGTNLLGVRAVLAQSFERIHRSNLVGMGVLPLVFASGASIESLHLHGTESYSLEIPEHIVPQMELTMKIVRESGIEEHFPVVCRLDSPIEVAYYRHGGILHYVLRSMLYSS
jgi:aconitate hydratase